MYGLSYETLLALCYSRLHVITVTVTVTEALVLRPLVYCEVKIIQSLKFTQVLTSL